MNYSQHIDLFKRYEPSLTPESKSQWRGNCPFHKEKTPKNKSFCVNMETGQYQCKSCGAKGNAFTFAECFGERIFSNNNSFFNGYKKHGPYNVETNNIYLLNNFENAPRIWNTHIVKLLKVGWDLSENSFVFPIFSKEERIINIKHHKGIQFRGSTTTLYPHHLIKYFDDSYIMVAEGEKDVVSLISMGFQAITSTGGATTIPRDISDISKFEKIYICFDNDDPGDIGIDLWIKKIKESNPNSYIRVCDLSEYIDVGGDVTDYFTIDGKPHESFINEIIERSKWAKLPGSDVPDYLREVMLSDVMRKFSIRDHVVLFNLIIRATRYRVTTAKINGMNVRMRPGEFITTYTKLAKLCGKDMTKKMVVRAVKKLVKFGFIKAKNLKMKRGMKFKLIGWIDENGHSESHSESAKVGIQNIKYLSAKELLRKINNGQSK